MHVHTTIRSWPAIAGGVFFAAVSAWVLLWDVRGFSDLNTDHVQVMAGLLGAIASGHFFVIAARQRLYVWALMFAIAFCVATLTCAITSAGRGAEVALKRQAEASRLNEMRADTVSELQRARTSHKTMTEQFTRECASGNGARCAGLRTTMDYADSHAALLQARLDRMQAEQIGNPKIQHAARMLSFFLGFHQARTEEGLGLAMPFMLPLICELLSVAFFGLGLGHRVLTPMAPFPVSSRQRVEILPPRRKLTDEELVGEAIRRAGRPVSNDELADLMGVSKSESSKRVAALGNRVRKQRHGRFSAITLA